MKISNDLKALVTAAAVSLATLGLTFGAGAMIRRGHYAASRDDALAESPAAKAGRSLFLKNCAHCHGQDARGDEGPDLHGLNRSDDWIAQRIRTGVKGQMTAFGEKFSQDDIADLISYLHTLR